jgi:ABC-type uncharacterized transport system fused permease/ATPase subunit
VLRSYATILVPSLLTAPRYFRGEVEFGVISQARRTPGDLVFHFLVARQRFAQ